MRIELRQGDITNQPGVEAIVNAANTELWLGSGVAGAIAKHGGPEIERNAVAQGPINLGEAIATPAGNLPNRFVIHAAAMGYRNEDRKVPRRPGSLSSESIIRDATRSSLSLADQLGCKSIAFPALATGVGGFPTDECAEVMIKTAKVYGAEHAQTRLDQVIFVLFSAGELQIFEQKLRDLERTG